MADPGYEKEGVSNRTLSTRNGAKVIGTSAKVWRCGTERVAVTLVLKRGGIYLADESVRSDLVLSVDEAEVMAYGW